MSEVEATIVVPAFREAPNLTPLVERVVAACGKRRVEVVVVDDNSKDGSEEAVAAMAERGLPVRIVVRRTERGLSSAVMRGFDEARGRLLLCMDGDLQHPPESVPHLLDALLSHDFAIGSRYVSSSSSSPSIHSSWPLHRRIISSGARLLARPLSPLSDPMTGFFALPRSVWLKGRPRISPLGFKICLETYIKCHCSRLAEVPIFFGTRVHGESKLDSKVMVNYLRHLLQLYRYKFGDLTLIVVFLLLLALAFFILRLLLAF